MTLSKIGFSVRMGTMYWWDRYPIYWLNKTMHPDDTHAATNSDYELVEGTHRKYSRL